MVEKTWTQSRSYWTSWRKGSTRLSLSTALNTERTGSIINRLRGADFLSSVSVNLLMMVDNKDFMCPKLVRMLK